MLMIAALETKKHITSPKDMVPDIMARPFALRRIPCRVPGSDSRGRIMCVHTVMYVCMYVCMSDPWLAFLSCPWCGGSIGRGAWPSSSSPQQNNGRMAHHKMRQGVACKTRSNGRINALGLLIHEDCAASLGKQKKGEFERVCVCVYVCVVCDSACTWIEGRRQGPKQDKSCSRTRFRRRRSIYSCPHDGGMVAISLAVRPCDWPCVSRNKGKEGAARCRAGWVCDLFHKRDVSCSFSVSPPRRRQRLPQWREEGFYILCQVRGHDV